MNFLIEKIPLVEDNKKMNDEENNNKKQSSNREFKGIKYNDLKKLSILGARRYYKPLVDNYLDLKKGYGKKPRKFRKKSKKNKKDDF